MTTAFQIRQGVRSCVAELLKMNPADIKDDAAFSDHGVDSIVAVGLIKKINSALGLTLHTTVLFDHGTVNQLASHIMVEHPELIASLAGQPDEALAAVAESPREMGKSGDVLHRPVGPATVPPFEIDWAALVAGLKPGQPPIAGGSPLKASVEPIAVVGHSGRYGRANTVEELWDHVARGEHLIEPVSRWDLAAHFSSEVPYCREGSFLKDIDAFDARFFNISGLEASVMDPLQRLFLEESWRALEDAGYAGVGPGGMNCGVYAGVCKGDYLNLIKDGPAQTVWGNAGAVVPARIAYLLDLQGPAIAVDTACSSSLVAIHLACQALRTGEIDMALAGGVFLQSTAEFFLLSLRADMLSPDGRCHAFDDRANGFVPGEGVGAVVLKRLSDALADGDHIHGVIVGTGINQDGATNGLTAPSARSQERLEREVYDRFGVHADDIQLVEAHGTGTRLGDPIEYQALTRAFRKDTQRQGYCAIGSVKTNIGHTVAAAGVAGLSKLLMALKHRKLPPSLNFEKGNAHIDFEASPFFVNTRLRDWVVPPGGVRRAVLSSFGISGTNAHLVLAEATHAVPASPARVGYLIALSAQSDEQLRTQVQQFMLHCQREQKVDLGHVSFTLLTARRHFARRFACVVGHPDELRDCLSAWLEGKAHERVLVGSSRRLAQQDLVELDSQAAERLAACKAATSDAHLLSALLSLAACHVGGATIDFNPLFSGARHVRVSLPTYPFSKDRYWVAADEERHDHGGSSAHLHPLVQRNTSNWRGPRYSSTLTRSDFFLSDHRVSQHPVLPGAAYLEMARTAVVQALEGGLDGKLLCLKEIVFLAPLVVDELAVEVHVVLDVRDGGMVRFQVQSGALGERLHCEGMVVGMEAGEQPSIKLDTLRGHPVSSTMDRAECYAAFAKMGLDYGAAHQGVKTISLLGDAQNGLIALGEIELPEVVRNTRHKFGLHPSLVDSALQCCIALMPAFGEGTKPLLPFALESVEVHADVPAQAWVKAVFHGSAALMASEQTFNVDIADESGRVCLSLRGLRCRMVGGLVGDATVAPTVLMRQLQWQPQALLPTEGATGGLPSDHRVWLIGGLAAEGLSDAAWVRALGDELPGARIEVFHDHFSDGLSAALAYGAHARDMLRALQGTLRDGHDGPALIQLLVPAGAAQALQQGLGAMLKSAWHERPQQEVQMITLERGLPPEDLARCVLDNARSRSMDIRYIDGQRQVLELLELPAPRPGDWAWRADGVYLITGGLGGLGRLVAQDLASRVPGVRLILTGKNSTGARHDAILRALHGAGAFAEQVRFDAGEPEGARKLVSGVLARHGRLDGVIHCAGVLRDSFVLKKTEQELSEVFSPKVDAAVALDEATADLPLQCFVLFSSMAGLVGNVGQADYAAANAFLDAFALERANQVRQGVRSGRTLAISWPLWQEGGMQVDGETRERLWRTLGLSPLSAQSGLAALQGAMAGQAAQVVVLAGNEGQILQRLPNVWLRAEAMPAQQASAREGGGPGASAIAVSMGDLKDRMVRHLKGVFSSTLKVPVGRIDAHDAMAQFGIDSLMAMELTRKLEQSFGALPKTLFFEYQSMDGLADYFVRSHAGKLTALLGGDRGALQPVSSTSPMADVRRIAPPSARPFGGFLPSNGASKDDHGPLDVAIIGVSGRYPNARTLKEYWENLKGGVDCISEIPKSRWDHDKYF
ncbi:MAG: SDR family NAD(P)-dependent oxidoreductase, partial [Aquabacterium sp.]|uniref:SDR family NAD(P)-dependent oxidoreductase n=1 Tax=Aquabacterium sp. TaxID=1872578 RepID=UPI00271C3AC6